MLRNIFFDNLSLTTVYFINKIFIYLHYLKFITNIRCK